MIRNHQHKLVVFFVGNVVKNGYQLYTIYQNDALKIAHHANSFRFSKIVILYYLMNRIS